MTGNYGFKCVVKFCNSWGLEIYAFLAPGTAAHTEGLALHGMEPALGSLPQT